jgi:hypothetical protein
MRMGMTLRAALLAAAVAGSAGQALAQVPEDKGAADLVGLFQQSCLAFAGQTPKLREWAASKKLAEMPAKNAAALRGTTPGKVYNATEGDQRLAVVSEDGGGCKAILGYGNQGAVDEALKGLFKKLNATVKTVQSKQSGNARQITLRVTIEPRTMTVIITTTPNPKLPSAPPRITLEAEPA